MFRFFEIICILILILHYMKEVIKNSIPDFWFELHTLSNISENSILKVGNK